MIIKMNVPLEGPTVSRRPGQSLDTANPGHKLTLADAKRLVERGMAELVEGSLDEQEPETALSAGGERAVAEAGAKAVAAKGQTR